MIYITSDHGGFQMKSELLKKIKNEGNLIITDLGCNSTESVDYPNIANNLCNLINEDDMGIIICGTGLGVSIASNRHKHIRCALCHNTYTARMAREHNNANILAMGGRVVGIEVAWSILKVFLKTKFMAGRHLRRIKLL